ncbi:aspartate carbamoyltransferase catalytic subunit [Bdellovibrio sp. SKB1291214]|uniref:aspartate carbamoyltransferase catalytic subunit n=1 Tax=Bdellovibrio sp. SKB1291214 TaxID=1732569 RepID=UPI000B516BE4|nr:aspartate carbamoyltransferase catalytic subunit [Bdellovibrio sp. SKB1291214]UYL08974.1 aspartate carbamoyltransferase catalytic subunit [Bdellovibrio sp. SKB1291214]
MSSRTQHSILDLVSLEKEKIARLFSTADQLALNPFLPSKGFGKTGALLFFEASTRTRMSFETACAQLGVHPLLLDGKSGSSLEKGETLEDTVLNVAAMKPAFVIIRSGDELDFNDISQKINMPVINAGWGKKGHPTQALLDAYTIRKHLGKVEGQKVLIVGDARHSRVAASHIELAKKLNYDVAFCGPAGFLPERSDVKAFGSLSEGLQWATVAMTLRVQLERHQTQYSLADYRQNFGFTVQNLKDLSEKSLIMHPGPINQGTEMDTEVLQKDPRCRVLDQVSNGVLIRQAILLEVLGGL